MLSFFEHAWQQWGGHEQTSLQAHSQEAVHRIAPPPPRGSLLHDHAEQLPFFTVSLTTYIVTLPALLGATLTLAPVQERAYTLQKSIAHIESAGGPHTGCFCWWLADIS